mmetsp:Transcript_18563/g.38193  ORF Transcript_18563/g.38193 Transcript_18563/m.38193 type:complete len:115 (-) Transcript_18563:379-723(-)
MNLSAEAALLPTAVGVEQELLRLPRRCCHHHHRPLLLRNYRIRPEFALAQNFWILAVVGGGAMRVVVAAVEDLGDEFVLEKGAGVVVVLGPFPEHAQGPHQIGPSVVWFQLVHA